MSNKILIIFLLTIFMAGCGRVSAPRVVEEGPSHPPYAVSQDDE